MVQTVSFVMKRINFCLRSEVQALTILSTSSINFVSVLLSTVAFYGIFSLFDSEVAFTQNSNGRSHRSRQNRLPIYQQFFLREVKQPLTKIVISCNLSKVVNNLLFWLLRFA